MIDLGCLVKAICALVILSTVVKCEIESNFLKFNKENLGNSTIQKCHCNAYEAYVPSNKSCVKAPNWMPMWDPVNRIPFIMEIGNFSFVSVGAMECEDDSSKLVLQPSEFVIYSSNSKLHNLALLGNGPTDNFCVEHIITDVLSEPIIVAEMCEINPQIPICCPPQHITSKSGTCEPKDFEFRPDLTGNLQWSDYAVTQNQLVCAEGEILKDIPITYTYEVGAAIIGYPLGTELVINDPNAPEPLYRQWSEYCVQVSEFGNFTYYSAQYCIPDPILEFNKLCSNATCIRKCCPEGWVMLYKGEDKSGLDLDCSISVDNFTLNYTFYDQDGEEMFRPEDLQVTYGLPFCNKSDSYTPIKSSSGINIDSTGALRYSEADITIPSTSYCIATFVDQSSEPPNEVVELLGIGCYVDNRMCQWRWILTSVMLSFSCIFYFVIIVVYIAIEDLRTRMVGRCLLSQVSSILIAYITLIVLQNTDNHSSALCNLPGTIVHIAVLSSFFWLNVMCFDMWSTIRSMRPSDETRKNSLKKYLLYCIYGWGIPLLIGAIRAVVDHLPNEKYPWLIRAELGESHCFISGKHSMAKWAYFYGPILALWVINVLLFIHVAVILVRTQKETSKFINSGNSDKSGKNWHSKKERAKMYLKLFLVMGISWLLEIIAWRAFPDEGDCFIWILDTVNLLQGFFIFLIFVCKKATLEKVKEKFGDPAMIFASKNEYQLTNIT